MANSQETLIKDCLSSNKKIVFFGGAGVSTESGIPDFRSTDGLYNQEYDYPPETMVSNSFFWKNPSEFYRFYKNKILTVGDTPITDVLPNPAHIWLAKKSIPVITQNIDGLHQKAGSKTVAELHGTVLDNYCTKCKKYYSLQELLQLINSASDYIPLCSSPGCNQIIKPDVVLYEEALNQSTWKEAEDLIRSADLLIIGGTSLIVYPAASLIHYFQGKNVLIINKTSLSKAVNSSRFETTEINQPIGEFFSSL